MWSPADLKEETMNRYLVAALAVSFGACVACTGGSGSSDPEDMSIPAKLNFQAPQEGPDKAKTDQDIAEFQALTGSSGVGLDLAEAVKRVTRTPETDTAKEQEYQDSWNAQSDITKSLATLLGTQITSKDCELTKTPQRDWKISDFKVGAVLTTTTLDTLSGPKCSVNARETGSASSTVKSITVAAAGGQIPSEYSAYTRMNLHAEGKVNDKSFAPATFTVDYNYSGPMTYKENQYYNMLFKGSYSVSQTSDGKAGEKMDCSMQWLVKAIGLTANPAYNYDYVLNCTVKNLETGKVIPADYHIVMEGSKLTGYEVYIAGRKFDYSALAAVLNKLPSTDHALK
jgi:hypothetical protein